MAALPAVSILPRGSSCEISHPACVVEDMFPGPDGRVIFRGGPAHYGKVREARAIPLGRWEVTNPPGRTDAQLEKRGKIGREIRSLAAPDPSAMDIIREEQQA